MAVNALSSGLVIWNGHAYLMIEATCPAESRIQRIRTICCPNNHDGLVVCLFP